MMAALAAALLPAAQDEGSFESRLLAVIPADAAVFIPPLFSRDGLHVAFAARAGGVDRIVRDGLPGPAHAFV